MKKRIFSMLMAVLMLVSLLPMGVLAEDTNPKAYIGETEYASLAAAIAAANGETIITLADGTHTLSGSVANKTLTLKGSKNAVVEMLTAITATGSTITFEGLTVEFDNDGYEGLQHSTKVVYKDCTHIGTQFLYAPTVEFNNCTFEMYDESTEYAVWTYGARQVTFTDCVFNTNGKAILVYIEGAHEAEINVFNCEFNSDGTFNDKAAVEVGQSASGKAEYTLNITNSTAEGFASNHSTFNLWGNKNDMGSGYLHQGRGAADL